MLPVLLTVREAAKKLGLRENAVYWQISTGHLPAMKLAPRAIRVREADLEYFTTPAGRELTVKEAAGVLRVSRSYVYHLVRQGKLPALKRGPRSTRVLTRDLRDFIESRPPAGRRRRVP